MDSEIIESVLSDILEEQRASIKSTNELIVRINQIEGKVDSFNEKLEQLKIVAPPADTRPIQGVVETGIMQMKKIVGEQPKSVVRQFRLLLFPEIYADNYYRIVFGRLLFWIMIFVVATYLFMLSKQVIQGWEMIKLKQVETNQYKKAWDYLYQYEKKLRVKMDTAWVRSQQEIYQYDY